MGLYIELDIPARHWLPDNGMRVEMGDPPASYHDIPSNKVLTCLYLLQDSDTYGIAVMYNDDVFNAWNARNDLVHKTWWLIDEYIVRANTPDWNLFMLGDCQEYEMVK